MSNIDFSKKQERHCPKCMCDMVRNQFRLKMAEYTCSNPDCKVKHVFERKYSCPDCENGRLEKFGQGHLERGRLLITKDKTPEIDVFYQCDTCNVIKTYDAEL